LSRQSPEKSLRECSRTFLRDNYPAQFSCGVPVTSRIARPGGHALTSSIFPYFAAQRLSGERHSSPWCPLEVNRPGKRPEGSRGGYSYVLIKSPAGLPDQAPIKGRQREAPRPRSGDYCNHTVLNRSLPLVQPYCGEKPAFPCGSPSSQPLRVVDVPLEQPADGLVVVVHAHRIGLGVGSSAKYQSKRWVALRAGCACSQRLTHQETALMLNNSGAQAAHR